MGNEMSNEVRTKMVPQVGYQEAGSGGRVTRSASSVAQTAAMKQRLQRAARSGAGARKKAPDSLKELGLVG